MLVQAGLCRTWSETTLLVFPRGGSNGKKGKARRGDSIQKKRLHLHVYSSLAMVWTVYMYIKMAPHPQNANAVIIITEFCICINYGTTGGQKIERTFCWTQAQTLIFEPLHRKTNNSHMRKQRRRSAVQ